MATVPRLAGDLPAIRLTAAMLALREQGGDGHIVTVPRIVLRDEGGAAGRLSKVGLLEGRQLGVGLSRSRRLGLGLRGAACPDVLKGLGPRVSLPVAHYSDMKNSSSTLVEHGRNRT